MRKRNSKEIGGYFELERFVSREYYPNFLSFSSARNCLLYVLKKRKIKTLYMPYYLCDVVFDLCTKNSIKIIYYHVDEKFLPILDSIGDDSYVYIVNYFGILSDKVCFMLKDKFKRVIFDYTHCFFRKPVVGSDTIYNCRKYFGVPDGAYLYSDLLRDNKIKRGLSFNHFNHLIGRYEMGANKFYSDFCKSDLSFADEDLVYMSNLSHNLLGAIDYIKVKRIRRDNFKYLHSKLKKYNLLSNRLNSSMDFMYPFMINGAIDLRRLLIENHIYVPVFWPNVLDNSSISSLEKDFVSNVLFLPIDQRYTKDDMDIIVDVILDYIDNVGR